MKQDQLRPFKPANTRSVALAKKSYQSILHTHIAHFAV